MKKITALIPLMIMVFLLSCNKDDDITKLEDRVEDLEDALDSTSILNYKDSLEFILAMSELEYRQYTDSLRRLDSLALVSGANNLPFTYTILVYDGSSTAVFSDNRTDATAAFDTEVTVSLSQFGEVRSVSTADGMASFDNIGRGIVNVTVSATDYTTLQFSFETLIDPSEALYEGNGNLTEIQYWNFVKTGSIGHDVAIFATAGEKAATLTGRAFAETDLTNNDPEVVPEGTIITAAIDVEDGTFQDEFILNRNKTIFTDYILSFGYDPVFTAATDANGDYTFTLAGAGNDSGLPYKFEYSDFLFDQVAFVEVTGEVTTEAERTAYGPELGYTAIPTVLNAATVSFAAGGGATATLDTEGNGSIIDIDLETSGSGFNGDPRVYIAPPPAGGTQATATATIDANGRVNAITVVEAGSGYTADPTVTITEGSGATATVDALYADGSNGGVADVQVNTTGSGYGTVPPNVLFSNAALTGTFATDSATIANFEAANSDMPTATASLGVNGTVSGIAIGNTGSNLTDQTPNVIVTSGFGAQVTVAGVDGVTGAIQSVTISNPGLYYTEIVTVEITSTAGDGAVVDFTINGQGQISGATISNGGTNYQVGDVITINGNIVEATASPVMEGLSIEDMSITNPGTAQVDGLYYENTPVVVIGEPDFKGSGSRQATADVSLGSDGRVIGINVTDAGSGYTAAPTVTIVSGSGATADATTEPVTITEVNVDLPGSGYVGVPRVEIYDANGIGSGAVATALVYNGQVTSITLDDPGTDYSSPQVVIVDPGESYDPTDGSVVSNPATAEVTVTDGAITAITMTSIGDNYPANTNIVLNAGRGTGFAATLTVTNGQITGVTVDNGGEDYIGGNTPSTTQFFSGINDASYEAKTGITRIIDIFYGTGRRD